MAKVTVNGCEFHVNERGSGPAVVLLHGFPMDGRIWDAQVAALSDQYRVIAPDLRGFGQSRWEEPFTMDSLAFDMQLLLRAMGALPCVLGGLSMGGYVALAYEQMCPTDLRGLMLIDTKADGDTPEGKAKRMRLVELARNAGTKAVVDQMLPKLVSPKTMAERPMVVRRLRQIMERVPVKTIEHAQVAMCERGDRGEILPSIADPVVVMVGEDDVLSPVAVAEEMRAAIPRARLEVIKDAGHVVAMERPERVNEVMREFVAGCLGIR